ncbi:MAG: hypothetical protein HZA52_16260 [Planctomycetes bacterium]|nr:hypothetical protein [Planctomycetota bacterium]
MTQIDPIVKLAGLALAHAASIVSELPEGEVLVPFAFAVGAEGRQLVHFEASTQEDAVRGGKQWLAEHAHEYDGCAFARDGRVLEDGVYVDVLVVEALATQSTEAQVFAQRYRPPSAGGFRLLGRPEVIIDGVIVRGDEAAEHADALDAGARSHPGVGERWLVWRGP